MISNFLLRAHRYPTIQEVLPACRKLQEKIHYQEFMLVIILGKHA
jgi:hypothetical protein